MSPGPSPAVLHERVLTWWDEHARPLPWREPGCSAWGVFVSEVMSQQTPLARVEPAWLRWMQRWPTPAALAQDSPGEAVRMWDRLGYPRRALRLWGSAAALSAAGVNPGDVILNTFSYHLTPAAFMFESGAEAIGCAVIPTGPGNTADQLIAIEQFQPSGYVGTPDFLKIILDKGAEQGTDTSSLRLALVSGAALPESLRLELAGRGVQVRQCYGTADLGIVAYEGDGPGMVVNEGVLLEIVRPGTGEPVPDGEVGEVVVTRLSPDYPLFRFATGDLSAILSGPSDDGRTNRRIRGWLGRADQATKVKGMFVRPEQVAAVARSVAGTGKVRLVVKREGEQDRMELWAEHAAAAAADPLGAKLAEVTKLKGVVRIVPPGTLPNDGKVIADER